MSANPIGVAVAGLGFGEKVHLPALAANPDLEAVALWHPRRERLDQDFTIYEKRDGAWIDSGLDQAVKNVNFDEVKRLGLLIKRIMDADRWVA